MENSQFVVNRFECAFWCDDAFGTLGDSQQFFYAVWSAVFFYSCDCCADVFRKIFLRLSLECSQNENGKYEYTHCGVKWSDVSLQHMIYDERIYIGVKIGVTEYGKHIF